MGLLLLLFIVLPGTYYAIDLYRSMDKLNDREGNSPLSEFYEAMPTEKRNEYTPPKWEGKQRVNILLLGVDSRGVKSKEIPRSDSNMVVSIDPATKKAHLFSILRDTYVNIPGHGKDRFNAAVAIGGPNLAMKTASDLLGLQVQYYVYTDFQGFIKVVDAVGGVEIDVEKNMKYISKADGPEYSIDLKKGLQRLNGHQALQYVRFRHDALSDYARTERQRKFLTALANELQTTSSVLKLPRIIRDIDPYIDTNLTVNDMIKLGMLGMEARSNGIVGEQIPPSHLLQERTIGGASVLTVDPKALQKHVQDLFAAAGASPSPSGSAPPSSSPTPRPTAKAR
ncbi:LCP family protein [Paenibacillus thermoaerophilus]|uniref:LCP family protein n=1 Tax=Paenibacillus thermoaerophilus TaxID=1215385 RepID=UPI003CCC5343